MSQAVNPNGHVFATLDGMRGIAAVAIVIFHAPDLFAPIKLPAAFLAVDLFFCLSGFVIAHAYGPRLQSGMSVVSFMKRRLIRLYPLFALSLALAFSLMLAAAVFGQGTLEQANSAFPAMFFLPTPFSDTLYPLNLPAWSLLFELLVNILAAAFWNHCNTACLWGILLLSGGSLACMAAAGQGLDGGSTWSTLHVGAARVTYSFTAGVLVYRVRASFSLRVPATVIIIILIAAISAAPALGPMAKAVEVLLLFPVLICLGSNSEPSRPAQYLMLGRLSFALYVLHSPALNAGRVLVNRLQGALGPPLCGLTWLALILVGCYLLDKYYDQPARQRMLRSLLPRRK